MDKTGSAAQSHVDLRPWAAFVYWDFTLLWLGGISGTVTMVMRTLVSAQWLYEETGSAAQLGLLGAVQLVQMPVVLYGGTLADRMDRKKLMALTQGVAFAMLMALTLLAATGDLEPWHIFAITGISGIVNMLGSSARPAMLPRVVPRHLLTHAVTSQTASFQVSGIVAPIVFWQVFEHFGVTASFAVAAALALASVISPLLIRASGQPEQQAARTTVRSLKDGYAFVMGHPLLPGLYSLDIGVTIVSFYRQLFPVFADQLYGMGAAGTGLLNTANSIGGVLGTMVVLYTTRVSRKGMLVLMATLVYAVLLFAFGVNRLFVVGLVIVALLGMTDSVGMTMRQTIVQLTTPDRLLGRASSAHSFSAMGANNLGQIEVGVLSGAIGAGNTMVLGGVVSVVVVAAIWRLMPGIKRYRYDAANPNEDRS
jgi:MFS family permease